MGCNSKQGCQGRTIQEVEFELMPEGGEDIGHAGIWRKSSGHVWHF